MIYFYFFLGFFNKPVDLSILDNFSFEEESGSSGVLPNGELDLPSEPIHFHENHADVVTDEILPKSHDNIGKNGITTSTNIACSEGGVIEITRTPQCSSSIVANKGLTNNISMAGNSLMQQIPVSCLGNPSPASPVIITESNTTRSEQPVNSMGMLSSMPMSLPASFNYPVQANYSKAVMGRASSGSNLISTTSMMTRMQIPLQNMNMQSQNVRFANSNSLPVLGAGPGAARMPHSSSQLYSVHNSVNGQTSKMQNFQNEVFRQISNQQALSPLSGMNDPINAQNVMSKFAMSNSSVGIQQVSFLLFLNYFVLLLLQASSFKVGDHPCFLGSPLKCRKQPTFAFTFTGEEFCHISF